MEDYNEIQSAQSHQTISLTLEDDTQVECAVLAVFSPEAGSGYENQQYIALLPLDADGVNQDGEVYIYHFDVTEDDQPLLSNIETDAEFQAVAAAFEGISDQLMA